MIIALVSGSSGPGSSPGRGHSTLGCVLGQFTHTVPLSLSRCINGTGKFSNAGDNPPAMD